MQGCSAKGITIIRGNIQPEHVHLLLSIPPTLSVAQIMQYLKGRSSKKLQEEFPKLRKQFWGQHMWATGYFCRSVGQVTRQTIEEYIENQKDGIEDIFVNDGNSMLQHRRSFSPHSKPCTLSAGWLIPNVVLTVFDNDYKGLRIFGKANYYTDGKYYDFCMKTFFGNGEVTPFGATKPKGAIVVNVAKVEKLV